MPYTQQHPIPIPDTIDLRDMLRQHLVNRAVGKMNDASKRRRKTLETGKTTDYITDIKTAVSGFYDDFTMAEWTDTTPVKLVSRHQFDLYTIENVIFESFAGWQVNATIYVPTKYTPPYPAVVIPVGHSGKQFANYQLPAQFFAAAGYIACVFDPPGQSSEKQVGNDHFIDGVRCYLVGDNSSRYFVADAIRCVDYMINRDDVDSQNGVAMTGVSGGGTTTILAALLDERISITGPSCCVTPRADLDIAQCYAGCPETHMWQRYSLMIDEIDLLCAVLPRPTLLMAGENDEVFQIEDTRKLAGEVSAFYETTNYGDHFRFFVDESGHAYTLRQAKEFVLFMDKWLHQAPPQRESFPPDDAFTVHDYALIRCYPDPVENMLTLTRHKAKALRQSRENTPETLKEQLHTLIHMNHETADENLKFQVNDPFRVWTHYWQRIVLQPEADIVLPATILKANTEANVTLLHFDDMHRNTLLQKNGVLAKAIGFLDENPVPQVANLVTVDLRGVGDSTPTMYPYDLAWWGGETRFLSYISIALGDSLIAQRVRDGLATLDYINSQSFQNKGRIVLSGCGVGGVVALLIAFLSDRVDAVITWDCLAKFEDLLQPEQYAWSDDIFVPEILQYVDLPEIVKLLDKDIVICNPLDGNKDPLTDQAIDLLNLETNKIVYHAKNISADIIKELLFNA